MRKKFINRLWLLIDGLIFNKLPMKNNSVLFISFAGQYNDNPRHISNALLKIPGEFKIYWTVNGDKSEIEDSRIIKVKYGTIKFHYLRAVCKVVVDNYLGVHTVRRKSNVAKWQKRLLKRKKQYNISTWHGTPFKRIDVDSTEDGTFTTCDLLTSGSEYNTHIMKALLFDKINILECGTPRNDILIKCTDELREKVRNKVGFKTDNKYILYAPTFRNDINDSGITQMKQMNIEVILDELGKKFGGTWKFAFRTHPVVTEKIKKMNLFSNYNDIIIDATKYEDMADYLVATDALITDYSGSLFDFALTGKPCFIYANDYDNYKNVERGTYLDIAELPYKIAYNTHQLETAIMEYDVELLKKDVEIFMQKLGYKENGNSSEVIANIISQKLGG